jgi:hypothetical protein
MTIEGLTHLSRLTANLLRPVPIRDLTIEVITNYVGRNSGHFSARLKADDKEVAHVTDDGWLVGFNRGEFGGPLRITRPKERVPWRAQSVVALPSAPYTVVVRKYSIATVNAHA